MSTPIIDYASPVPRSLMRLPARSEIRWADYPGRLVVTQVLAGREGAVGALLLAGFTFVLMSVSAVGMAERWNRNTGMIGVLGVLMAAEAVVSALVIRNTWRRTVLTVTAGELCVEASGPLTRRERYVVPSEQVAGVLVVDRAPIPGAMVVAELEIRLWNAPPLHLFAGHPPSTLRTIAAEVARVQPVRPPPLPASTAAEA